MLNVFMYLLLLLLAALAVSYFLLIKLEQDTSQKILVVEKALVKTADEQTRENQALEAKEKIDIFSNLLVSRQMTANLFSFIEKATHPRVWFSKFEFDSAKRTVKISGQAESFYVVGQQVLALKNQDSLKEVKLSDLVIDKEKGADFVLSLVFNPQLFAHE